MSFTTETIYFLFNKSLNILLMNLKSIFRLLSSDFGSDSRRTRVAVDGFFTEQFMPPFADLMPDHVTIGKVGADEAVLFVAGRHAPHFFQGRQINPDVIVLTSIATAIRMAIQIWM